MSPFQRHIDACNNLGPVVGFMPLRLAGQQVGFVHPELAFSVFPQACAVDGDGVHVKPGVPLQQLADALAARGLVALRGEMFDVRASAAGPVLDVVDRGAVPRFAIIGQGVHVNGLVRRADGLHVWVGLRSRTQPVAPGKLDHVVAGGMPAGMGAEQCLVKEAAEEASIPAELARQARKVARLSYAMAGEDGLRRDVLHCYDLDLPEGFTPRPNDDEVERFELWPVQRLFVTVRDTMDVKFNVYLVLIDLFLRQGLIDAGSAEGLALRAGLDQGPRD